MGLGGEVDTAWMLQAGFLVFFMQLGFAVLEAGTIRTKNVNNILFKNIMDASLGSIIWFLVGYAFAFGDEDDGEFIGSNNFALGDTESFATWFFQWAFAATAATIVSGSVAERTKLDAYFAYSVVITGFIYPVVVHWVWDGEGWMNAGTDDSGELAHKISAIDFAGSGVVHMVGGFSGLMGAIVVGPRLGRFGGQKPSPILGHNVPFQVIGTFILWFGWYGFNCGSTLGIEGYSGVASRVACTTTLAAAAGCITAVMIQRYKTPEKPWDLSRACNGVLAGLVSITAGCSVVSGGSAIAIGFLGAIIYMLFSAMLEYFNIDDPLDAASVHGAAGFWGVLAAGLFKSKDAVEAAYSSELADVNVGTQFGHQLTEAVVVTAWTCVTAGILFKLIDMSIGMRVSEDLEKLGMDKKEHGDAYTRSNSPDSLADSMPAESQMATVVDASERQ